MDLSEFLAGIMQSVNSTLGKSNFKPLDKLMSNKASYFKTLNPLNNLILVSSTLGITNNWYHRIQNKNEMYFINDIETTYLQLSKIDLTTRKVTELKRIRKVAIDFQSTFVHLGNYSATKNCIYFSVLNNSSTSSIEIFKYDINSKTESVLKTLTYSSSRYEKRHLLGISDDETTAYFYEQTNNTGNLIIWNLSDNTSKNHQVYFDKDGDIHLENAAYDKDLGFAFITKSSYRSDSNYLYAIHFNFEGVKTQIWSSNNYKPSVTADYDCIYSMNYLYTKGLYIIPVRRDGENDITWHMIDFVNKKVYYIKTPVLSIDLAGKAQYGILSSGFFAIYGNDIIFIPSYYLKSGEKIYTDGCVLKFNDKPLINNTNEIEIQEDGLYGIFGESFLRVD